MVGRVQEPLLAWPRSARNGYQRGAVRTAAFIEIGGALRNQAYLW